MRKELWNKIFLLFCMGVCLSGIFCQNFTVKAKTEKKNKISQFDIEAETALGNYTKLGRNSQMKVTITNHGEDFNGLVQIIISVNGKNIMNQKDFFIGDGETKNVKIPFRMQSGCDKISVCIADENENVLEGVAVKVTVVDTYDYFVGVLTDNKQGMGYIENYTKVSWLDEKRMPDSSDEIDALDRIYINDFQTAKLSKEQYNVLKTWVEEGGDLVIGTGVNAGTTLGIFQDDFLKGKVGEGIGDNRVELSFQGEQVYQDEKGNYNIHNISVGKGSIWIYDVDLAVPSKEWKETGARYINYQLNQQFGTTVFPNTEIENALYVHDALNVKDAGRFPSVFLYGIIFLIYVLCVSFLIYFILKKMDKLEKTWVIVPLFSLLFIIVIFILGNNTRITGPYMMYRGEICFSGENDTNPYEKNILQLSSASNKNYTLAIPKGRTVYSEQGDNDDLDRGEPGQSYKIGFYQGKEHQYITIKNVSAFEHNTLISEQNRNMGKGYESKIVGDKFQCQGTFTNHTGYTLKYAILKTENECHVLGTVKDGEAKEINKDTVISTTDIDAFSKSLFGTKDVEELTVEAMRYWHISYDELYEEGNTEVFACIDLEEDREKMNSEWGINCDGITTCKMPIEVDYTYKGDVFVPNIVEKAKDVDNVIDSDGSFDYSKTQSVDMEYTLKQGDILTGIYYLKDGNPSMEQKDEAVFDGEVMVYNYKTMKYEMIFESGKEKSIRKVSDYVNQENVLKIQFKTNKRAKDEEWEYLPVISLSIKETE